MLLRPIYVPCKLFFLHLLLSLRCSTRAYCPKALIALHSPTFFHIFDALPHVLCFALSRSCSLRKSLQSCSLVSKFPSSSPCNLHRSHVITFLSQSFSSKVISKSLVALALLTSNSSCVAFATSLQAS